MTVKGESSAAVVPGLAARQVARRKTRLAQVGAVLVLALAVGLLVLPVSGMLKPEAPRLDVKTAPSGASTATTTDSSQTVEASARVLAALNPRVQREKPVAATPPPTTPQPDATATPTTEPAPTPANAAIEWAYLGSIVSPKKVFALVRAGGTGEQLLMAVNDTREGRTLEEVYLDHIILSDGEGNYYRVDLLPPTQVWPEYGPGRLPASAIAGAGGAAAGARGAAVAPGGAKSNVKTASKASPAKPNWGGAAGPAGAVTSVSGAPGSSGAAGDRAPAWAAQLPPGMDYKTVNAETLAKLGIDPNQYAQEGGPRPRDDYDPVELESLMRKVEANDYDPEWVATTIESLGLPRDSTFDEKVGFFKELGITVESNLEFIKKVEEATGGGKKNENTSNDAERAEREAAERAEREAAERNR